MSSLPQYLEGDRFKPVAVGVIEVKFNSDELLEAKIKQLKGLLAHRHPEMTLNQLFHKLCDLGINQLNPANTQQEKRSKYSWNTIENDLELFA